MILSVVGPGISDGDAVRRQTVKYLNVRSNTTGCGAVQKKLSMSLIQGFKIIILQTLRIAPLQNMDMDIRYPGIGKNLPHSGGSVIINTDPGDIGLLPGQRDKGVEKGRAVLFNKAAGDVRIKQLLKLLKLKLSAEYHPVDLFFHLHQGFGHLFVIVIAIILKNLNLDLWKLLGYNASDQIHPYMGPNKAQLHFFFQSPLPLFFNFGQIMVVFWSADF